MSFILMRTICVILFFLLPLQSLRAKEDMDMIRANYYFTHLSFYKAIPYYERIATERGNSQVYARLGDCYRLTGDMEMAAYWYKRALSMSKFGDVVELRYGQVLMQLMQYDSAAKWLMEYQAGNANDRRVANLIAGCKSAPERWKNAQKGAPALLPFNTDHSEFAPVLWNGNLVFAADTAINVNKKASKWTGNACYNTYAVTCDGAGNCGDEFMTLGTSKSMNIEWHDGPCTFNAAGDTMYFTRTKYNEHFFSKGSVANKDSIVVLEIMVATDYDEGAMKFKSVHPFTFKNKNSSMYHPTIAPSGRFMIFSSTMHGSGSDLFMCSKARNGKWLKPQSLGPSINTEGEEVFPFLINDSTLCFASDGHEGLGGLDIYISHWDTVTKSFSRPVNAGAPINSSYDDISMAISADGTGGYFSSNRPAEKGSDNIYFYRKE
jgi:hypothetical protein